MVRGMLIGAGIAALAGCAGQATFEAPSQRVQLEWPEPPEVVRYRYMGRLRALSDIRPENEQESLKRRLTGQDVVSTRPVFIKPAAVAARNGRVYVADPPSATIAVFDLSRQRIFQIGLRDPAKVRKPVSIAVDDEGRVYVLDGSLRRVFVYDALGLHQFTVGDPKALTQPTGVAVSRDGKKIFVVDRGSLETDDHKVIAYSPDGSELFRLGPRGSEPGQFNIPLAATVSPDGILWILDSGNFRVQGFDLEGRVHKEFGKMGAGLGQFSRARSIAADPNGNIFVSDGSFNNVQIFNPDGELLMWIGNPGMQDSPGRFGLIGGVAADEAGHVYIIDQYHTKIEVYRPEDSGESPISKQ